MNIQSIKKFSSTYYFVLLITIFLVTLSSCQEDKASEVEKLDYATLISGDYKGELVVGQETFNSTATITKGSIANELIFTEKLKTSDQRDSTTSFKIELMDLNSKEAIALRIPIQQIAQRVTIAGTALKPEDPKGTQGYFFYQNEKEEKLNKITFLITANNGEYYYNYKKVE